MTNQVKSLGKTLLDNSGITKWLDGEINIKDIKPIPTYIDRTDWENFKIEINELENDPVQVDLYLKAHGLDQVKELKDYILNNDIQQGSVNNLIQTQNYKNIANQAHGFTGVKKAIDEYNKGIKQSDFDSKKFNQTIGESNSSLGKYLTGLSGANAGLGGYARSLATATLKTFALEAATAVLNATISWGVSIIITGFITAIDNLIHREERLIEAAEESSENIKDIKSSFDNLKKTTGNITKEFAELSQHVDQITGKNKDLSTEQYERFLELSNQLAESLPNIGYTIDENGNKIVNLTGSIDEITQSINNLVDAERLLSNQEIDQNMDDVFDKALEDLQTYHGELENTKSNSSKFMTDTKEMVTNLLNGKSLKFDLNNETNSKLFSDLQDLFDDVGLKLNTELVGDKISLNHTAEWAELSNEEVKQLEAGADRITHKYKEMASKLSDNMSDIKNNIQNTLNGLSTYLNSWVTTSFDYNTIIQAYGSDLGTAIQKSINSINWAEVQGVNNWDDAKQWIEENILVPLKDVKNSDIREAYIELFTNVDIPINSAISYLEQIEQYFKDNDLEIPIVFTQKKEKIEDVKNRFKKRNSSFTSGNIKGLNKFFKDNGIDEQSEYEKWLAVTEGITDATKAMEAWNNAQKEESSSNSTPKSFSEAWNSLGTSGTDEEKEKIQEAKDNLLELAKSGKLTQEAFEGSIISDELDKVGISSEKAVENINKMVDSSSQLSSMKSGISSISEILGQKTRNVGIGSDILAGMPEEVKSCTKEYNNFCKVLGKGNSKMSDCRNAANKLATAYVNSNNFLSQLNDTNKDYYISQLSEMGVANANEIVTNALTQKKALAAIETANLSDMTSDEINQFIKEKAKTEDATIAMRAFALEKIFANGNGLDTTEDVNQLANLVEAFGIAAPAIKRYRDYLNGDYNTSEPGGIDPDYLKKESEKEVKSVLKKLKKLSLKKYKIKGNKNTQDKKKDKKDKTKESKQEIDWIDRRLTSINNKLNLIKSQYENITSTVKGSNIDTIVQKQNKNLSNQISLLKKLYNTSTRAASKYSKKAENIKISKNKKTDKSLKNLVKSEAVLGKKTSYKTLIKKYGQTTADKISSYRDYYDKVISSKQSAQDYKKQITEATIQKYQNQANKWQSYIDKNSARLEVNNKDNVKDDNLTLQHSAKEKEKYIKNQIVYTNKLYAAQKQIAKLEGNNQKVVQLEAERRKTIVDLQIEGLQNYADEQEATYNLKQTQESMATDYKKKNILNKQAIASLKSQYSYLIKIAKKQGDSVEATKLQLELTEKINESSKTRVQNVIDDYEKRFIGNNRQMQIWNNAISLAEAKGKTINSNFYNELAAVADEEVSKREQELANAKQAYADEMKDNPEFINSSEWYDTVKAINDASDSLEQAEINATKYRQKAIEANWAIAESAQTAVDYLNEEAETYKTIFGYKDMFDKDGKITDEGTATFALNVYGIENYINKIKKYYDEIDKLNQLYKEGKIDVEVYDAQMEKLTSGVYDSMEGIYSLRDAMKSLIEEGLNAELDSLNEMIDKIKNNLSEASSLRDYQKNIEKQTKNIASLERQIRAKTGDTSEKGRADVQKLKLQLEEAKSDLEDTEYDKYIEDQERILDDLSSDFQDYLDAQLDQVDSLLEEIIKAVENGEINFSDAIKKVGETLGIDLSKVLSDNLAGFAKNGQNNSDSKYDDLVNNYMNSAYDEYNKAFRTTVINTDEQKGTETLNGYANNPTYQKNVSWLKSKGFSDNDINKMYDSIDNAQNVFTGLQNASSNMNAEDIFNAYRKEVNSAHKSGKDTPNSIFAYKYTDAYANEKSKRDAKVKLEDENKSYLKKIIDTLAKSRSLKDCNFADVQTGNIYKYGSRIFAHNYGKYLSATDAKNIDSYVKQLKNVDTGKALYNTTSVDDILKALNSIDSKYGGMLKDSVVLNTTSDYNKFANGGVVDGTSYRGDKLLARINSGESVLTKKFTDMLPTAVDMMDNFIQLNQYDPSKYLYKTPISNSVSAGDINIHLDGSHVNDINSLVDTIKHSPKVRNMLQDVVTSGLSNDANAYLRR